MKILLHGIASNWNGSTDPVTTICFKKDYLAQYLSEDFLRRVVNEDGFVYMRALDGNKKTNRNRWAKISSGDISITHGHNTALFAGTVIDKVEDDRLSSLIGLNQYDQQQKRTNRKDHRLGRSYRLVYFLRDIRSLGFPKNKLMSAAGHKSNYSGQAFIRIEHSGKVDDVLSLIEQESSNLDDDVVKDIADIHKRDIPETMKERLSNARCGQGRYRDELLREWDGCCSITQCNLSEVLTASHIKPWRKSSDDERLNPKNGLLLIPNFDKLFDRGFISFNDSGEIIISEKLEESVRKHLGINSTARLSKPMGIEQQKFMKFHRENEYERWKYIK